jgi:hypothetical protein
MANTSYKLAHSETNMTSFKANHKNCNLLKSISNRNLVISPKVLDYTKRYNTFLNKTVESILFLTETVYEAKANLDINDFTTFTKEVGLKSEATISKFITIGEKVSRLSPYKNNLPCSWTTLYKLARMKESDFDKIKDFLWADMSVTNINDLLSNSPLKTKVIDKPDFKIYLELLNQNEKLEFANKLHKLIKSYKVHMFYPAALSEKNCVKYYKKTP